MNKVQAMRPSLRRFSLMILILGLQISAGGQQAKCAYRVDGVISHSVWQTNGFVEQDTWSFEARVKDDAWLQATVLPDGQKWMHGCDGRDAYHIFWRPNAKNQSHLGVVFSGTYPIQSPGLPTTLPWLAYCSRAWFESQAAQIQNGSLPMPLPWFPAAFEPEVHAYRASVRWLGESVGLPAFLAYQPAAQEMDDLKSGIHRTKTVISKSDQDRLTVKISSVLQRINEPQAVYRVIQSTNFNGCVLPTEFALECWAFIPENSSNMIRVPTSLFQGKINQLMAIEDLNPYPKVDTPGHGIHVADYRFFNPTGSVGWISYKAEGSAWRTEIDDPFLQALYKDALSRGEVRARQLILPSFAVAAIFVSILFFPLYRKGLQPFLRSLTTKRT